MVQKKAVIKRVAKLTPASDTNSEKVSVDDSSRLREIRALVIANNQSSVGTDIIICQIYMESRFDADAHAQGSSARGLMQLLRAPVRELARLSNLKKPLKERRREADLFREADMFHDSPEFVDEATNIKSGTAYLQALIDSRAKSNQGTSVEEAYKDYRGIRNGIYYRKIKAAADELKANPDSMQILREMVK